MPSSLCRFVFLVVCLFSPLVGMDLRADEPSITGIPLVPDPPPSIDGKITRLATVPGWQKWDSKDQVVFGPDNWKGPDDLSGECLVAWDHNYLYVAARVTDDHVAQPYFGINLWNGDHVMLIADLPRQPGENRDPKKVVRIGLSPGNLGEGGVAVTPPEVYNFGDKEGPIPGAKVAARRTVHGYDIEAALPWKWFGVDKPDEGVPLGYDVIVSDADDKANPKQEKLASLLTSKWRFGDPNRLLEAALAETDGHINPAKLVSFQTTPLGDPLQIESGKTATIHAPNLPKVKELVVQARLIYEHLAGGSPGMHITLNGTPLDMSQIRNRLDSFTFGVDEQSSYLSGGSWYLLYAPDFVPPAPFTSYYTPDIAPYDFRFDVTGLWKPDDNVIEITDTSATTPIAVNVGTSEQLSYKLVPAAVEPAPTGEISTFEPFSPLATAPFKWSLLAGGAVNIALGDRNWVLNSAYSTTDPGWAHLAASAPANEWKTLDVQPSSMTATTRDFTLKRTIATFPDHITVSDQLTNVSQDDLPVLLKHSMDIGTDSTAIYIAGRKIESPQFYTNEGEAPTSLALYAKNGIGLVAEDDVLRAQGQNFIADGAIGLQDSNLVLAKGNSVTTEFSVYPMEQPDSFLFINRIRAAWNVNFKFDGGGTFMPDRNLPPFEGMTDDVFGKYIQDKDGHFVILGLTEDQGSKLENMDITPIQYFSARVKKVAPDSKVMPYYHCFLSQNLDDKTRFAKDALMNPNGSQADYGAPIYPLFVPREGSDFAKEEEGLIALRFDKLGADGIYWDELEYSSSKWDYNPNYWDGFSGDINPDSHQLIRKTSNVMLATQSWRARMITQIMQHAPLLGNGAPETRTVMNLHFPRFIETGSITNLSKGQLYTPIALGDHLTEKTEVDCYRDMVKALNYGCVYYWYHPQVPVSRPTISSLMFPITPMRIGPGFIVGQERIITNRSGYFGWGDRSTFAAKVFDEKGLPTDKIQIPLVDRDGKNYAEVRIPGGCSVALLRLDKK